MTHYDDEEMWADIIGTNGIYQVSNHGRMRSFVKRGERRGEKQKTPTILKLPINKNGYYFTTIRFCEYGILKTVRVHRLVAEYFVKNNNPSEYDCVLHNDDNKLNCHHSNLTWGNYEQNNRDAFVRKVIIPAKGEARKKSSLTEADVLAILNSTETARKIAKKYGVNHTAIVDIKSGRSWNHVTGKPCTRNKKPKYSTDIQFI